MLTTSSNLKEAIIASNNDERLRVVLPKYLVG